MENIYRSTAYTPEIVTKIETMGATAVSIANRWMTGWPDRVSALLKAGTYVEHLESQLEQEKVILANESNLRHLSRREILELYEIREAPPALT
ncbi:MAG TPA: hypothetical protein VFF81_14775 [Noviherbaspirillum sp.]|nr:hypothetical protein [Noviherbaspirillum sp.]